MRTGTIRLTKSGIRASFKLSKSMRARKCYTSDEKKGMKFPKDPGGKKYIKLDIEFVKGYVKTVDIHSTEI